MIEFRCYYYGSKLKKTLFPEIDTSNNMTTEEIFEVINEEPERDFKFFNAKTKEDITDKRLLDVLHSMELNKTKNADVKLMNRIIRGGGLINYIKKIEYEQRNPGQTSEKAANIHH